MTKFCITCGEKTEDKANFCMNCGEEFHPQNTAKKNYLDKDVLLAFYREFNSNRIDYNTQRWKTVQFFTLLNSTFITATIALLTSKNENLNTSTKGILSILPLSVLIISYLGRKNIKRETRLLWEQEASMFKIEKYLGLHVEVPEEKRWLKNDPYLVPSRNHETIYKKDNSKEKTKLGNLEEWNDIEQWLNFRWQIHKFRPIIKWVFYVEAFVAAVLIYVLYMC